MNMNLTCYHIRTEGVNFRHLSVCPSSSKPASHQDWSLTSDFHILHRAIHQCRTYSHALRHSSPSPPHTEGKDTYPLQGRSWVDLAPLGMSHQPAEAAGEEALGAEPLLPWQQHTCTVNEEKEREEREIFHFVLLCKVCHVCMRKSVCACHCSDTLDFSKQKGCPKSFCLSLHICARMLQLLPIKQFDLRRN